MPGETVLEGLGPVGVVDAMVDYSQGDAWASPWRRASGRSALPDPHKPACELTAKEIGAEGEEMATSFLARHGYEVVERNWHLPNCGEADIVLRGEERGLFVLAEVKTRLALEHDHDLEPEIAVDRHKRNRYCQLALTYYSTHPECTSVRFDVIAVILTGYLKGCLRHLSGAYSWDEC